jgi:hypothetical protein
MLAVLIEIELDAVDYQVDAFGAIKPTTAGRTLDVSAGGEAGIDLANVGSPTTTVNLSGVTIKTATDIETDTQDIQNRLPAALVDGRIVANAQVVTDKTGYTATISDKTGFKLASDGLASVTAWTVGITGNLTGNVTGSVGSISGVSFPSNFSNLGIDPSGSILSVDTVDELGANALTANGAGDAIPGYVWDEVLTGATHNVPSSAGRRLRQIASSIVYGGTAQGPGTGNNQIQLDTGASATNGAYDPALIAIEAGTGAGQTRLILQYVGSTRTATVDRDWRINPDNTSEFVILGDAGRESVNEGLAQGGTSTSITLNASASSTDDAYNGQLVFIRSGTGQDQVALVEDYVGSTKVATIRTRAANGQWATIPNTTSAYVMIPNLTFTVGEIADGVWDEALSGHLNSGSTGEALNNSGGSGNPWITDIATGYSGTQAGNILNQVKAKTDLITSGSVQTSIPVTAQGQITGPLYIGDDYLTANGRSFDWIMALPTGFVAATSTCKFGMDYSDESGPSTFLVSGTVTDVGGGNVRLRFELPRATTGTLKAGFHRWSTEIVSAAGVKVTAVAYADRKLVEWREKQT